MRLSRRHHAVALNQSSQHLALFLFYVVISPPPATSTNKTAVATRGARSLSSSIASWSDMNFISNVWIVVIVQR
jgi:hypothetical protein